MLWRLFLNVRFVPLFNQEAIEIWADTHCQNCLSAKHIMLNITQPFFSSCYELHLTLWSFFLEVKFKVTFQVRNHRNLGWHPLLDWLSVKDIALKVAQPFFKKLLWITFNIMKVISGCKVCATFQSRSHRNVGHCLLPELPLCQKYHAKNYSAFLY